MGLSVRSLEIRTSGSTGVAKTVVHTEASLFGAADMAVEAFGLGPEDRFFQTLPPEHVSGLMLDVRAQVCGGTMIPWPGRWDARRELQTARREEISRLSLVPAQLFDWAVTLRAGAPRNVRTVWIGGDRLSSDLKRTALALGWPVVETYGMTETAGMIAVKNESRFSPLPGVEVREVDGRIALSAPGLFAGYRTPDGQLVSPSRVQGLWLGEDRIQVYSDGDFEIVGRSTEKILGEKVSWSDLRDRWEQVSRGLAFRTDVVLVEDPRSGLRVELRTASGVALDLERVEERVRRFNESGAPYERIQRIEVDAGVGLAKTGQ